MEKYGVKIDKLIYENSMAREQDVADFVLEGEARITFPEGRMRLENAMDASNGQKANYVLWCPEEFPENLVIEWEFLPIREPGLSILFFAAKGINGEDILSSNLQERTGEYVQYHHGDINAFHVSYFRRKEPDERAFHTCNLRKSYGFHLVAQGGDPIPNADEAREAYKMAVVKCGNWISFYTNELEIFRYEDDGKTCGELLGGGKVGFRQLAPMIGEYAQFKVYTIANL